MIYVTHDQVEAMTLGDRIVVMHAGRVQQIDAPLALYERPRNTFVAGFIGSPSMNFITGQIVNGPQPRFRARGETFAVPLPTQWSDALSPRRRSGAGQAEESGKALDVVLGVRPEDVSVASPGSAQSAVRMRLDLVEPMGHEVFVHASAGDHELTARVTPQPLPDPGAEVALTLDVSRVHFFDATTRESLRAEPASS
jgi:multiple sugar transport system ATP-binding protein